MLQHPSYIWKTNVAIQQAIKLKGVPPKKVPFSKVLLISKISKLIFFKRFERCPLEHKLINSMTANIQKDSPSVFKSSVTIWKSNAVSKKELFLGHPLKQLQGVSKGLWLKFLEDISASNHPISELFFSPESCAQYETFKLHIVVADLSTE